MRYPIGEIVLVVIGILIALQINDWNDERREKSLAETNLENLKLDLINDKNAIKRSLSLGICCGLDGTLLPS